MSLNDPPVKIVLPRETYECFAGRRARERAEMGLPPEDPKDSPWLCEDDVKTEEARQDQPAANLAPPPPTRGPLCRAAKAKVAERNASIPGFERHSRKCQVCRSPYVVYIEQLYVQWENVSHICRYFQLADTDTLYRHARAAGLDVLRRQNSRWVVEQFIEQWRAVKITSATVIRSIRALSCLDDKGQWTDLPKTLIVRRASDEPGENEPSSSATPERTSPQQHKNLSSSSERSEPRPARDSVLPAEALAAAADSPAAESSVASPPSSERSEPNDENSSENQTKESSVDLEPQASSPELPEPNRVSMEN